MNDDCWPQKGAYKGPCDTEVSKIEGGTRAVSQHADVRMAGRPAGYS